MRKVLMLWLLVLGFLYATSIAYAEENLGGKIGVGVNLGTLGYGGEIRVFFTPKLGARLALNYLNWSYDAKPEEVEYDVKLKLFTVGPLVDWYPFGGSFRVSAGVLYNGNNVKAKDELDPEEIKKIGDTKYTGSQIGTLKADIDFNNICPYIGIGYDKLFGAKKRWGFFADLGVMYQGSPDVKLKSEGGTLSNDPTFLENLKKEEKKLEDEVDTTLLRWFPVVRWGLLFKF